MSLENNLNTLQDFVDELQATSSSNSKKEIIKIPDLQYARCLKFMII